MDSCGGPWRPVTEKKKRKRHRLTADPFPVKSARKQKWTFSLLRISSAVHLPTPKPRIHSGASGEGERREEQQGRKGRGKGIVPTLRRGPCFFCFPPSTTSSLCVSHKSPCVAPSGPAHPPRTHCSRHRLYGCENVGWFGCRITRGSENDALPYSQRQFTIDIFTLCNTVLHQTVVIGSRVRH